MTTRQQRKPRVTPIQIHVLKTLANGGGFSDVYGHGATLWKDSQDIGEWIDGRTLTALRERGYIQGVMGIQITELGRSVAEKHTP